MSKFFNEGIQSLLELVDNNYTVTNEKRETIDNIKSLLIEATDNNFCNTSGVILILKMEQLERLVRLIKRLAQ